MQAFICDAIRTPIGRYGGALAGVRADDLGAIPLKALMALVAGGALLVGCSAPGAASAATPAASQSEASADIVRPQRIVAITSETADMALLLAGPQSMAAIAVGSQSPAMGMVPDLARQVETTLPAGVTPDPEQILSYQPDLVLTTSRHGAGLARSTTGAPQIATLEISGRALAQSHAGKTLEYPHALQLP